MHGTMRSFEYDEAKFAEMVLYAAEKLDGDPSFGATKLNKVLFFSDFFAYQELGKPISGAEYQKLPHGPAPRRLLPVQRALEESGDAKLIQRNYLGKVQKRLAALRDADVRVFEPAELKVMDQVIDALEGARAVDVSRVSHDVSIGWQVAKVSEAIPYQSVFIRPREAPTESDRKRVEELAGALAA